jgi:hypothetical protein
MSDLNQPEEQPGPPPPDFALGGLGAGEYDTSLGQPAPAGDELTLPRTALLAFRKSGGLRFRSQTVIVFRSGWVLRTEGAQDKLCHLDAAALARLARLALCSGLARQRPSGARQPPDGSAYEVAARIGRHVRRAEVFDGSIPADLAALIRALSRLLS